LPDIKPYNCPVLALAVKYERTVLALNQVDASAPGRPGALDRFYNRLDKIVDQASRLRPQSFEGAAFQIMLASAQPSIVLNGSTPKIQAEAADRIERLLHNALHRLELTSSDIFPAAMRYMLPAEMHLGTRPSSIGEAC
jgi:hypothetical protein